MAARTRFKTIRALRAMQQLAACDAADDVENATGGKLEALGVNVVSSARLV
jgi:hypothetical protein